MKESFSKFFDAHYKKILIIPIILIILCFIYLFMFYSKNNDVIYKDVSLTGGTTISVNTNVSIADLHTKLVSQFPNLVISSVSDNSGKQTKLIIIVPGNNPEIIKSALEESLGINLTDDNSSIEFTESSLSQDFYAQLLRAIVFAFLLMALVVFLVFGQSKLIKAYCFTLTLLSAKLTFPSSSFLNLIEILGAVFLLGYSIYLSKEKKFYIYSGLLFLAFILVYLFPYYYLIFIIALVLFIIYTLVSAPSMTVISCAFADIIMPLVLVDMLGIKISSAGIVAFLMLIGYSVDTDILLTSRALNRKGEPINKAIFGAFKTGTTMTLTSIASITIGLLVVYSFQSILNQIFLILIIGLAFDLFNTWVTNVCLIKWYVEKTGK